MIESILASRAARAEQGAAGPRIAFARPRRGTATVMGDGHRLERAIDNIIDNAISFSPPGGLVCIAATRLGDEVPVRVDDDGLAIPAAQRGAIRPEAPRSGKGGVVTVYFRWCGFNY